MLKKRFILPLLCGLIAVNGLSLGREKTNEWRIRTGIELNEGLWYQGEGNGGDNGGSMALLLEEYGGFFHGGAGLEFGFTYGMLHLVFPLEVGIRLIKQSPISLFLDAFIVPGIILTRPAPCFIYAAEAGIRLDWAISNASSLSLSVGSRYFSSPEYAQEVGPSDSLDLRIRLETSFLLNLSAVDTPLPLPSSVE